MIRTEDEFLIADAEITQAADKAKELGVYDEWGSYPLGALGLDPLHLVWHLAECKRQGLPLPEPKAVAA